MSPLWRDEISIHLAPRRLTLARTCRGIRPRRTAEVSTSVENPSLVDWRPALAVVRKQLVDAAWQGAQARLVISDHWAKYAIVPWASGIANDTERLMQGRICLSKVYGNIASQWRVCLSEGPPGVARVACALPEELLSAVRTTLDTCGLQLVSVQPQLIAAYNQWRARLPRATGWFVTIDEGSLAAARLVREGWDRVYSARIGSDWVAELQRLKMFGRLAAQQGENGGVYVDAPPWLREIAGDCGSGIEWLVDEHHERASPASGALQRPLA